MSAERGFLARWGGFTAVGLAMAFCFSTSSVPTPLYPLYQAEWGLQPSAVSYIFAAYMMAVLVALMCFGRISDTFGRLPVITGALSLVMLGLGLSAAAQGVMPLIIARAIIGFGNGLLTTASALALTESHPDRDKRAASTVSSTAITVGFGFGPVIAGGIAQFGVAPLALPYVFFLIAVGVCLGLALYSRKQLQGPSGPRPPLSIRPQMALPVAGRRPVFLLACIGAFANFTCGSLFFSQVPAMLRQVLPWNGPAALGAVFSLMAIACVLVQMFWRQIEPFKGLAVGMSTLLASLVTLVIGLVSGSVIAILMALAFLGFGQGFTFMTSAVIAGMNADDHRRAANMSTYFLSAYIGATIPVIVLGVLADYLGLFLALYVFVAIVAALLGVVGWRSLRHRNC